MPDHFHPPAGNTVVVAVVELRRHRVVQQVVEGAGLEIVSALLVDHLPAFAAAAKTGGAGAVEGGEDGEEGAEDETKENYDPVEA